MSVYPFPTRPLPDPGDPESGPPKKPEDHEPEEKNEELWLVSYADMMTLLFGLFVMLYSLSVQEKSKAEKALEGTAEYFGAKKKEEVKTPAPTPTIDPSLELNKKIEELSNQLKKIEEEKTTLASQMSSLAAENKKLLEKIPVAVPVKAPEKKFEVSRKDLEKVKSDLKQTEQVLQQKEKEVVAAKTKISELETLLENLKRQLTNQVFMAVTITWDATDHDIDLQIIDPENRKYDFKNRKHEGSPGLFMLDSRRGPGTEVWQTEKVIPGTYKIKYVFYNDYGNTKPSEIKGTIFTPKGKFEIPLTTLDRTKKSSATFSVKVEPTGEISFLK